MILFSLLLGIGFAKLYNLDETSEVFLPVGGSCEIEIEAEINRAHTWLIDELDIVKLIIETLPPRSKNPIGIILTRSAFKLQCTRDCKPGEQFDITLKYTDLMKNIQKDIRDITVTVIDPKDDL
jgi:hypothetical protein